jgi:hypothetical protein
LLLNLGPFQKLIVAHGVKDFSHFTETDRSCHTQRRQTLESFLKYIFNIILFLKQHYSLPEKCNWSQECWKTGGSCQITAVMDHTRRFRSLNTKINYLLLNSNWLFNKFLAQMAQSLWRPLVQVNKINENEKKMFSERLAVLFKASKHSKFPF